MPHNRLHNAYPFAPPFEASLLGTPNGAYSSVPSRFVPEPPPPPPPPPPPIAYPQIPRINPFPTTLKRPFVEEEFKIQVPSSNETFVLRRNESGLSKSRKFFSATTDTEQRLLKFSRTYAQEVYQREASEVQRNLLYTTEVKVQQQAMPYVIGQGGKRINAVKLESGCDIKNYNGSSNFTITGLF